MSQNVGVSTSVLVHLLITDADGQARSSSRQQTLTVSSEKARVIFLAPSTSQTDPQCPEPVELGPVVTPELIVNVFKMLKKQTEAMLHPVSLSAGAKLHLQDITPWQKKSQKAK